jgi:hypothetical protein
MRKAIIAAIVATALFAVGAFAANFALSADNVSSGSDSIETCAERVEIDFAEVYEFENKDTDDWEIESITATFFDAEGAFPTCASLGAEATIIVEDQAGEIVYQASESTFGTNGDNETVTFTPTCAVATCDSDLLPDGATASAWTNLPVAQAWNAALLINGNEV